MKKPASILHLVLSIVFLGLHSTVSAQTAPGKYLVEFTDKEHSSFVLSDPHAFLSPACIERRLKFGLGFDQRDLPVSAFYIEKVLEKGQATLHQKSKWFNAITVILEDSTRLDSIRSLPFVRQVKSVRLYENQSEFPRIEEKRATMADIETCTEYPDYGPSFRQIEMLQGQLLHAMGFRGEGVTIAQFDAGWDRTNQLPVFERLRNEGRILGVHDFVLHGDHQVYNGSAHGSLVLSTMAGDVKGEMIGTAPSASYYFFRTEDPYSEYPVEEDNWVAAAEMADSLGVDVINSSLGYSLFENPELNHSYEDMNGNTTRCSIAADIAASKGVLVVNSAGNSGDDPWKYITAPSDADSILCVGAVNADLLHAPFSSYGPSSDGDVKPDLVTMGWNTRFARLDSTYANGNGTSFASPILAGMAACLVQAFPDKSNMEIIDALRRSGDRYENPDDAYGYGLPNIMEAFYLLSGGGKLEGDHQAMIYPNPATREVDVVVYGKSDCRIAGEVYDTSGRRMEEWSGIFTTDSTGWFRLDISSERFSAGQYYLHLAHNGWHSVLPFQKIKP